jgi:hypothetical protein
MPVLPPCHLVTAATLILSKGAKVGSWPPNYRHNNPSLCRCGLSRHASFRAPPQPALFWPGVKVTWQNRLLARARC